MKNNNTIILLTAFLLVTCSSSIAQIPSTYEDSDLIKMDKSLLYDKIKGG